MSGKVPENEVFEVERVKSLIELMRANELSEIDLKHGERRIRLRRGDLKSPQYVFGGGFGAPAAAPPAPAAPAAPVASPSEGAAAPAADADAGTETINSPMVGTFYSKPNPDSKPYVQVGDTVTPDTIVCQIEAMKMFSEIPAGISGTVTAVLVKNEDAVDVNKPLFRVRPS